MAKGEGEANDLRVVMAEIVESARRAAAAGAAAAMRMQAANLRSTAELFVSQARTLDAVADDVEGGRVDLPRMPVRLSVVPLDDVSEAPVVDEPDVPDGVVLAVVPDVQGGGVTVLRSRDYEGLSVAMIEWLGEFDERFAGSPFFVVAINEAAEAGCALNEQTTKMVAARIGELTEARDGNG